jgi:hypothetical protein
MDWRQKICASQVLSWQQYEVALLFVVVVVSLAGAQTRKKNKSTLMLRTSIHL